MVVRLYVLGFEFLYIELSARKKNVNYKKIIIILSQKKGFLGY